MEPIPVLHFSDVLCVWAYVSQVRIDELAKHFGPEVRIESRFCPVFGAPREKLAKRWADRGGLSGYGAHVRDVVEPFDHVRVHPDVWRKNAPSSSLSAHVFLCAVRHLEATSGPEGSFSRACARLREAFFVELADVGRRGTQLALAEGLGLPVAEIEARMDSGVAHAELSVDHDLAREHDVKVSPTLILDGGRQRLNGNVGYRVIEANVRELMHKRGAEESSWC